MKGTNNREALIKRRVISLCALRPRTYDELAKATGSPRESLHVMVHRWCRAGLLERINPGTHEVRVTLGGMA